MPEAIFLQEECFIVIEIFKTWDNFLININKLFFFLLDFSFIKQYHTLTNCFSSIHFSSDILHIKRVHSREFIIRMSINFSIQHSHLQLDGKWPEERSGSRFIPIM